MIQQKKVITPDNALDRLEDLCARSEVCTDEARKKLIKWKIEPQESERILKSLIDGRYIDNRRYGNAFVRDKLYFSHWGKRKIALSLHQKRLDRDIIAVAIDSINNDDYISILKKIVQTKAGTIKDYDTYEGRTKIFRFAVSRGFEPELVSRVIREILVK